MIWNNLCRRYENNINAQKSLSNGEKRGSPRIAFGISGGLIQRDGDSVTKEGTKQNRIGSVSVHCQQEYRLEAGIEHVEKRRHVKTDELSWMAKRIPRVLNVEKETTAI